MTPGRSHSLSTLRRWFAVGPGWHGPAAAAGLLLAAYAASHQAAAAGAAFLVAIATGSVAASSSLLLSRIARGVVLRAAGSHEPVVLLGRWDGAPADPRIRPRWRIASLGVGAVVCAGAALAAFRVVESAVPTSPLHAAAVAATAANVALLVASGAPTPGLPGWALALALVEAAGATPGERIERAARFARIVGAPLLLALAAVAALAATPVLIVTGVGLAYLTWTRSSIVTAEDAIARFLAPRHVDHLARPIARSAHPDERVLDVTPAAATGPQSISIVSAGGGLVGIVGPRQLVVACESGANRRCDEVMVPLRDLTLIGPSWPAVTALPELARHGFALTRDGRRVIETADLASKLRVWAILARRGPALLGTRAAIDEEDGTHRE